MAGEPRKREVFANPFFVVLMATSVLFVLTVFAYLVSPYVIDAARLRLGPTGVSVALAVWVDRNGPLSLAIEFGTMLVTGVLAMVTDPWFSPRRSPKMGQAPPAAPCPDRPGRLSVDENAGVDRSERARARDTIC